MLDPVVVKEAHERIAPFINGTPLLESHQLNDWLGHRVIFKVEGLQRAGAFKFRGAINGLLCMKERGHLPEEVVAFSSGNHAQAMALAARIMGIRSTVYITRGAALVKRLATVSYGAEVILTETRQEAEAAIHDRIEQGATLLHPYDNDDVIAGQGTACFEVLQSGLRPDAIVATCGGGGWLAGTLLASRLLSPASKVIGAEPLNANDAARSLKAGSIFRFPSSPDTLADGAQTLAVAPRTFPYLQQLEAMVEVPEESIIYWSQWLNHLLKTTVEPTSAVAMGGLCGWLREQHSPKTALVLLSGGNIAAASYRKIWERDHLNIQPSLHEGL